MYECLNEKIQTNLRVKKGMNGLRNRENSEEIISSQFSEFFLISTDHLPTQFPPTWPIEKL